MLQKTIVTRDEFCDLADKVLKLANNPTARACITEMKFSACYNAKFRNKTYPELEELYEELKSRLQSKA